MQSSSSSALAIQTQMAETIARFAIEALLEEVHLTPKPGLVDCLNNGCHHDLNLPLMTASAESLYDTFYDMALAAADKEPSQRLREQLAAIGRFGEQQMLKTTDNVNTHKGAIWCLGLLSAASAIVISKPSYNKSTSAIFNTASAIAEFPDRYLPVQNTHGGKVFKAYNVAGAKGEAILGFPSISCVAMPVMRKFSHETNEIKLLNVFLALMATVDDTCILHRGDMAVLKTIQQKAGAILQNGGLGVPKNRCDFEALEQYVLSHWVSPGGSADLLAGTIFIQKISNHFNFN